MGHVRMMAAAQPFISGAISKTVNMPEHVTVEEVEQLFVESWKLGLKAVAIYRDNCKVAQPLSADKKKTRGRRAERRAELAAVGEEAPAAIRPAITTSFRVGDAEGYITAGDYPDDGIGEIFLKVSKQGSTLSGIMDAFSIAVSVGLQYGVPLEDYVSKFINMRFEPSGYDERPRHPVRVLDRGLRVPAPGAGPPAAGEAGGAGHPVDRGAEGRGRREDGSARQRWQTPRPRRRGAARHSEGAVVRPIELIAGPTAKELDAPLCYSCGSKMQPAGSCYVCGTCGSTSGCS